MNFILYEITCPMDKRTPRLNTVYGNVRSYMRINYLPFGGGYLIPEHEVEDCLKQLDRYVEQWKSNGGPENGMVYYSFELQCSTLKTFRQFTSAMLSAAIGRLEATYEKLASKAEKGFSDKRTLKSLACDRRYIERYADLYAATKFADIALRLGHVELALSDGRVEAGLDTMKHILADMRHVMLQFQE